MHNTYSVSKMVSLSRNNERSFVGRLDEYISLLGQRQFPESRPYYYTITIQTAQVTISLDRNPNHLHCTPTTNFIFPHFKLLCSQRFPHSTQETLAIRRTLGARCFVYMSRHNEGRDINTVGLFLLLPLGA
jgi:hypothetical protein